MKKIFKKFGFTLAEILIVIGIIGGIAIMVLPTIKDNYEEHVFESRAKATYNILQQAVALSKYSGDRYYGGDPETFFNKYIKDSIKLSRVCGYEMGCGKEYDINTLSKNEAIKATWTNNNNKYAFSLNNNANVIVIGSVISYVRQILATETHGDRNDLGAIVLMYDTNGPEEPNILGLDTFVVVWNGRELVPAGSAATVAQINENCSPMAATNIGPGGGQYTGTFCLQYMIDNGWKIKQEIKDEFL